MADEPKISEKGRVLVQSAIDANYNCGAASEREDVSPVKFAELCIQCARLHEALDRYIAELEARNA